LIYIIKREVTKRYKTGNKKVRRVYLVTSLILKGFLFMNLLVYYFAMSRENIKKTIEHIYFNAAPFLGVIGIVLLIVIQVKS